MLNLILFEDEVGPTTVLKIIFNEFPTFTLRCQQLMVYSELDQFGDSLNKISWFAYFNMLTNLHLQSVDNRNKRKKNMFYPR